MGSTIELSDFLNYHVEMCVISGSLIDFVSFLRPGNIGCVNDLLYVSVFTSYGIPVER